jgi:glycosyltransferase involved in cell wall biosynthesis
LFIVSQPFFQWRGSPIRIRFDVQALAELGFDVDLLVLPVGQDLPIPGVQIHRALNILRVKKVAIGPSLAKAIFDGVMLVQGLHLAGRFRYAVVHGVEDAGAVAALVAKRAGCPFVFEKHSDPSSHRSGWFKNQVLRAYAAVERWTIRRAACVIGTGPGLVEQARRVAPGGRIHHIFDIPSSLCEADAARTVEVRRSLEQAPGEILVMFVGSFAVYQGIDLLFGAMPRVVAQCPAVRFVIIGGTPGEIGQRRAWLRERGCEGRVHFPGLIPPDDLPNYLSAADILVSPRVAGVNTPLKLLDYLKAGRAIVATDTESNRLILTAETAVLVAPAAGSLADGIVNVATDAGLRERLARSGRKLIDATYNFQAFKQRLAACYREAMET